MKKNTQTRIAIVGTGPAALMAGDLLSRSGFDVYFFEKKPGPGRKLLIAGSSGLNVTNSASMDEFLNVYSRIPEFKNFWSEILNAFSPSDWIQFIESLGLETFKGTSRRYFVKEMKASGLLRKWVLSLTERKVQFFYNKELTGFEKLENKKVCLTFNHKESLEFDAVCLSLGGASYEAKEEPLRWLNIFEKKNIKISPFLAANVGYQVAWKKEFLTEAEGLPLKNIEFKTTLGSLKGDLMITSYGIEGTPVYTFGTTGNAFLDLKPELTEKQMFEKCQQLKENFSPIRKVKKQLNLSEATLALLFHESSKEDLSDLEKLLKKIKNFPLQLHSPQPITEAISSAGGICFSEIDFNLMLKKVPGVFLAGEMLDWTAPTGGFLIQACVSQGFYAAKKMEDYLIS